MSQAKGDLDDEELSAPHRAKTAAARQKGSMPPWPRHNLDAIMAPSMVPGG
ncbi:MAG: hypothetical protein R2867_13170 [Caldilineaceae bacterium]